MNATRPLVFLVGESDAGNAIALEQILRRAGLVNGITRFSDGGQVLDFLREGGRSPDRRYLLVLDTSFPSRGGLDVLNELRRDVDPDLVSMPALLLCEGEAVEEELAVGALRNAACLQRPLSFGALFGWIDKLGLACHLRSLDGVFDPSGWSPS